jgi:hypothetical protein
MNKIYAKQSIHLFLATIIFFYRPFRHCYTFLRRTLVPLFRFGQAEITGLAFASNAYCL